MMKNILSLLVLINFLISSLSFAQDKYLIEDKQSQIEGFVKYAGVGKYIAQFKSFEGEVIFDPKNRQIESVLLKIKTKSLKSKRPRLDKFVLSKRLLDANQFPEIIFKSKIIEKTKDAYYVTGNVNMHGITQKISFSFTLEEVKEKDGSKILKAKGRWILNRKYFKVIWNTILDKGGIIVDDHIIVDWNLIAVPSAS